MKPFDVIVIGSGIGGCAAGVLLANSGLKTLIIEKNRLPGGRLSSFEKDGFQMDLGVHMISCGAKGPVVKCLERAGAGNMLEFVSIRPKMAVGGKLFNFPSDVKEMVPEADYHAMIRFIKDIRGYDETQITSVDDITLFDLVDRYTKNKIVKALLGQIGSVYCAIAGWELSAGEFIRCFNRESECHASGYPKGGCIAITNAFINRFKQLGGTLLLNTAVERILVKDNRAVGVLAGGEEYRADIIVSNAGIPDTVCRLVGEEKFSVDYMADVKALKYSRLPPVLRIALDRELSDIKMFSHCATFNQREYAEKILKGEIPEEGISVFLVVPSNFSDGIVPEGKQYVTCTMMLPIGTNDETGELVCEKMFEVVEHYIPGYKEHMLFSQVMTPKALEAWAGKCGSCIGLAQIPRQVGVSRPSARSPLPGLYYVGCETGKKGGVGIEFAVNSAMEWFDTYLT